MIIMIKRNSYLKPYNYLGIISVREQYSKSYDFIGCAMMLWLSS